MVNGDLRTERQVCDAFQNYRELWQTLSHCKRKLYNELSTTAQVLIARTLETSTVHQNLF